MPNPHPQFLLRLFLDALSSFHTCQPRPKLKIACQSVDVLDDTRSRKQPAAECVQREKAMLKRYWVRICLLALAVTQVAFPGESLAQQVRSEGKRKMVVDLRPVYPPLARKLNMSGIVRLRVTVSPAGYPVRTEELGGSPLLMKAAADAVSRAKWEPTSLETKEIVEIKFQTAQK